MVGIVIFFFFFGDFEDLTINDNSATNDAQNRKKGYEYAFGPKKLIEVPADKKTKKNTTDHGQAKLCNYGKVFNPWTVFLVVEKHFLARPASL
jgi:hypothetical protein